MDADLISDTAMDVSIALDTLLENIDAFLEKQRYPHAGKLEAAVKGLWDDAYADWTQASPPPLASSFDQVTDTVEKLQVAEDRFRQLLKDRDLPISARRQAALEGYRVYTHRLVAKKLKEQLERELASVKSPPEVAALTAAPEPPEQQVFNRLTELLTQADLLGDYTTMWTVYERAWLQHNEAPDPLRRATHAGDAIVRSLYREIESQDLRLKQNSDNLVTAFFENRLLTRVAQVPAPYVVAPLWGVELVWNWLAFGHEVGHHVYTNVGEEITENGDVVGICLGDELFVHVTAYLLTLKDGTQRRIWRRWLEEIFADLFCLLRLGPVSVRSMQHMFFHLPPQGLKRFLKPPPRHREWLLRADDDEHPIPYLRVFLGLDTLEILGEELKDKQPEGVINHLAEERSALEERWNRFFGEQDQQMHHHFSKQPLSTQEMREVGRNILRIMLTTPLYALEPSKHMGDKQPRRLVDAFFDLDVDKINTVFKHLDASERSEFFSRCQTDLISGNLSVRHILAGSQLEFERVVSVIPKANQKDYLERLSEDTINLFNEYGEEYQSKEYLEMLT